MGSKPRPTVPLVRFERTAKNLIHPQSLSRGATGLGERLLVERARDDGEHTRKADAASTGAGGAAVGAGRLRRAYSHSIVAGGFVVTSYTTRLTPATSLTMRLLIRARSS